MNFPSLSRWMRRFLPLPTIIALAVVAFITFYGDNSVVRRIEYDRQIDSLRHELKANRDTMLYYRELNARLSSDPDMVESVVRQEYNMARPTKTSTSSSNMRKKQQVKSRAAPAAQVKTMVSESRGRAWHVLYIRKNIYFNFINSNPENSSHLKPKFRQ